MKQKLFFPSGRRLELWAAGSGFLRIEILGKTVWQIPRIADHPEFFRYHHREACEVTITTNAPEAILWAYGYDPKTVNADGIIVFEFSAEGIVQRKGAEIDDWLRADPERPRLHFSPIRQWMNDPNGLCKMGEDWHVFYQFHPASTEWGPMHWGHATSKDLFHWTHLPVFLHPEQNLWRLGATGGAFSGNAFRDREGSCRFFYTERLPAYDLFRGYREVQKVARPGPGLLAAEAISLILEDRPEGVEHDFRDPKVWWDEAAQAYRMVLGASIEGDPAVLLYGSPDGGAWRYLGPLYRAEPRFRVAGARAVECPDFFPLSGKWVLVMGFVGYTEPGAGRHNLLFALTGEFAADVFTPFSSELQTLDFGSDFYAMQSFQADGRQIALAWVFNWEDRKPAGSPYSGELSLPRELRLDAQNRLCLPAASEFDVVEFRPVVASDGSRDFGLSRATFRMGLDGPLDPTHITATQNGELCFEVTIEGGSLSVRLPQDDGSISYRADIGNAADMRLVHDRGIVEIFLDNGAVCGTRRNYTNVCPDSVAIVSHARISVEELSVGWD